ncbi:Zinc resistance conferring protein [Mycoemilia scoparia]|uniref:Zinc resistance conferring protein n=1 Tax=Mycoemilia scoparia TaxID=417184 RepID=A0A9W8DSE0_9FUNG|nr:Zinc resistance conferring protein [Mycoemilia scoparia]
MENPRVTVLERYRSFLADDRNKYWVLLIFNSLKFVGNIAVGIYFHYQTILADGSHVLGDVVGLAIALIALNGGGIYGSLGSGINIAFLIGSCFSFIIVAIELLVEPHEAKDPFPVFVVGIVFLCLDLLSLAVIGHHHGGDQGGCSHGHSHSHSHSHSHHHDDEAKCGIQVTCCCGADHSNDAVEGKKTTVYSHNITRWASHLLGIGLVYRFMSICGQTSPSSHNHKHQNGGNDQDDKEFDAKKETHKAKHQNMLAMTMHIIGDVLTTLLVVVGALINWKADVPNKDRIDPITSVLANIIIIAASSPVLITACKQLAKAIRGLYKVAPLNKVLVESLKAHIGALGEVIKVQEIVIKVDHSSGKVMANVKAWVDEQMTPVAAPSSEPHHQNGIEYCNGADAIQTANAAVMSISISTAVATSADTLTLLENGPRKNVKFICTDQESQLDTMPPEAVNANQVYKPIALKIFDVLKAFGVEAKEIELTNYDAEPQKNKSEPHTSHCDNCSCSHSNANGIGAPVQVNLMLVCPGADDKLD